MRMHTGTRTRTRNACIYFYSIFIPEELASYRPSDHLSRKYFCECMRTCIIRTCVHSSRPGTRYPDIYVHHATPSFISFYFL